MPTTQKRERKPPKVLTNREPPVGAGEPDPEQLDDPETAGESNATEVAPSGVIQATPPPGAQVRHRHSIDYTTVTSEAPAEQQGQFAGLPAPGNALADFLEEYDDGAPYTMQIIREADPFKYRSADSKFNRPCYGTSELGFYPFNRASFIDDIQGINKNSGGFFTVNLWDDVNALVGSWRGQIADPYMPPTTRALLDAAATSSGQAVDPLAFQIEMLEKMATIADLQRRITGAVPGNANATTDPNLLLMQALLGPAGGNMIGTIVGGATSAITTAVNAATSAANLAATGGPPRTAWEMFIEQLITDPAMQTRISDTAERVLDRVIGTRSGTARKPEPQPNPGPGTSDTAPASDETEDDSEMIEMTPETANAIMIDYLTNECAEGRALDPYHEIFTAYKEQQPALYERLLQGIALTPLPLLIMFIVGQAKVAGRGAITKAILDTPEGKQWLGNAQEAIKLFIAEQAATGAPETAPESQG